ncbi:MAG: hypothetical protein J7K81_01000 [Methanophagales archaeon]|nr:hypothetical protein [Methanophagales archaeon]
MEKGHDAGSIRARFELLRANKNTYEFLIGLLREFTKDGLNDFHFHLDEGKRFFKLLEEKNKNFGRE